MVRPAGSQPDRSRFEEPEHLRPWTPSSGGDGGRALADAISINAVFSAGSGLVLLAGAPIVSGWLGVDGWLLAGIGAGLLVFAGVLVWLLTEPRRLAAGAWWVFGADVAWIGGAGLLLTLAPTVLSAAGRTVLAAVTVAVALIVLQQVVGLRRRGSAPLDPTSPIALRVQRTIAASPDRVWDAVSDAGDYARFAPGIAATRIVGGQGQGMERFCRDDQGGEWAETCTLWDPGHRYRMSVDVDSYPAYYRMVLAEFTQTWTLEPARGGTHVRLEFDGRVKLGILGRSVARLLGNPRRLDAILDAYERELTPTPSAS
jgi:uncharacterized protein YndB with AHSA1/START domain